MIAATKAPTSSTTANPDAQAIATRQHAFNALSTAAWYAAQGNVGAAMARIRRATAHLKSGAAA